MKYQPIAINRRSFLKTAGLAGGGFMLSFGWLNSLAAGKKLNAPVTVTELNGYLKISGNGLITIMSPNPEGGQNVKTSMPMVVAEELDADWKNVTVEQAPLNTKLYSRQFIGGSLALRSTWKILRTAGATARQMLREAAANAWSVPVEEITTKSGVLYHTKSGKSAGYGELASAAALLPVPKEVKLKDKKDFTIIGSSQKNVDVTKIISGKRLYAMDIQREGMLIAMIVHPPAFGMTLKSFDASVASSMPGIKNVFPLKVYKDDYELQFFDTCTFTDIVAIVGRTTWEVMNAKKALKIEWEPFASHSIKWLSLRGDAETVAIPAGLESTAEHKAKMAEMKTKPAKVVRKDGDPETAFKNAARILERTYTAPFLAHNCMEPLNFFAHVTPEKVELAGPLQKAELTEKTVAARLGIPMDKIDIQITRLGGGFGRKSYAHYLVEAALISQKVNAPVKLIYTREDDMTSGIYRSTYSATYRAALDANNNLVAFHVKAGGIPSSPMDANLFPAGAVQNYLAETWEINSNITQGSFRAPRYNFMAASGQSFMDELAEFAGRDPIEFQLGLLDQAAKNAVGKANDYDAGRYAGVLKLVREKSDWGKVQPNTYRGVAAFFCMNSYVAEVIDIKFENGRLIIPRVCCATDCGIVVNPDAATNLTEGCIVDGIGNAMFGEMTFKDGVPEKNNFSTYRMIRQNEAPKAIDVHFVQNEMDPTGMGEPPFPPVFAALANALYKATGKRFYNQPFISELNKMNKI